MAEDSKSNIGSSLMLDEIKTGIVSGKKGRVRWEMTADEAEEIAEFIEHNTLPKDVARNDVRALREAIAEARRNNVGN